MTNDKPDMRSKKGPPRLTLVPKDGGGDSSRSEPAAKTSATASDVSNKPAGMSAILDPDHAGADSATVNEPAGDGDRARNPPPYELGEPVSAFSAQDRNAKLRIIEAVLFAAQRPMSADELSQSLSDGDDATSLLGELQESYAARGINLTQVAGKWAFRTAEDLSYLLQHHAQDERRLSKAALETLSIIAYHQPVTRAEIEDVRGVTTSSGTIDILLETGWIRPRGRRRAPGRPVTYGTTETFLEHFALDTIKDLPGLAELKGAGLLDANLPPGFTVPEPQDIAALMPDELPLEDEDEAGDLQGALSFEDADEEEADLQLENEDVIEFESDPRQASSGQNSPHNEGGGGSADPGIKGGTSDDPTSRD